MIGDGAEEARPAPSGEEVLIDDDTGPQPQPLDQFRGRFEQRLQFCLAGDHVARHHRSTGTTTRQDGALSVTLLHHIDEVSFA